MVTYVIYLARDLCLGLARDLAAYRHLLACLLQEIALASVFLQAITAKRALMPLVVTIYRSLPESATSLPAETPAMQTVPVGDMWLAIRADLRRILNLVEHAG